MDIEYQDQEHLSAQEKYDKSAKGKSRRSAYKRGGTYKEKYARESVEKYLSRPFIAWDGEGVTLDNGDHIYITLANSEGGRIDAGEPLGIQTVDCFDFMLAESNRLGDGIHVIYGGGYDFNMMFRDFTRDELDKVYHNRAADIRGYHLEWRPGKSLRISKNKQSILIYDVVSFFQTSFVNACDAYLGEDWPERDRIVREKERRGTFTLAEAQDIATYNDAELVNLVSLCNELRARLYRAGIRIPRWDGPGAVAASLMKMYGVKQFKDNYIPEAVAEAARYAYMGGRFECFQFGYYPGTVYQYDIKSAYPSAMRYLPCLAHGKWVHHSDDPGDLPYAIYHVSWGRDFSYPANPGPFPVRYHDGSVGYPEFGETWSWSPEIAVVRDSGEPYAILECWEWRQECNHEPFAFVEGLYRKRQILQRQGDGAHVGLKLGLNSLYGKLAQQLGWHIDKKTGELKIPPFHQLEWAGFVTSHCRAQLLRAALQSPRDIIAFETDALFSKIPLDLPLSDNLGEWDLTEWREILYLQSGTYFGWTKDGKEIAKTRGVDKGVLDFWKVLDYLDRWTQFGEPERRFADAYVPATLTRFTGAGVALAQDFDKWRRWITSDKMVHLGPQGKRVHLTCYRNDQGPCKRFWHYAEVLLWADNHSHPFPIEWVNPNPDMRAILEELSFQDARQLSDWEFME